MVKRCSNCILPETLPNIRFNSKGVCNFCLSHRKISVQGEEKLKKILSTKKGEIYDCVVPISGGKDSTYVLYYAVKILKLKVIAVNYNSGFQSDLAKENIKNACRLLRVPLVVVKTDYENQVKMLKEILCISEISTTFFGICGNCEANIRVATMNVAKKYNVPFVLTGGSVSEGTGGQPFAGLNGFVGKISRRGMTKIIRLPFHIIAYSFYSIRQRTEMHVPIKHRFVQGQSLPLKFEVPLKKKGLVAISFFDYVEYDLTSQVKILEEKLRWKSHEGRPHRFDCLLHCFVNHHWLQASQISQDGYNYSTMIREGCMKREDALFSENLIEERLRDECLETIEKIGLKDYEMPKIARVLVGKRALED